MIPNRIDPQAAALSLFNQLHPGADCVLFAGSFVRGEATANSDLDLVILYSELPLAYRESLVWEGYPVETFVHSPQTLRYFFERIDAPTGYPRLMQMVCEGIEIPEATPLSAEMKQLAKDILVAGPPLLTDDDLNGDATKSPI